MAKRSSEDKIKQQQQHGAPLVTYMAPKSVNAEQFRTLRTNLQFAQLDRTVKSILVTSSVPAEGKSTISANLAHAIAATDKNVLIVDADLRKPTVHRTFHLDNSQGLTTLLADADLKFNQVVKKSKELGMYFLTSGPIPPNPAELLASGRMTALMRELAQHFDYIIYDAPPVTAVTDAQIMATKVDGVVLVVRSNYVRKDELATAKKALDNVNANMLGFVMNDKMVSEGTGYYYYYGSDKHDD